MKVDLSNKLAVVTGSSAGIGLAIATQLFENGASVILNGRSMERLQKIEENLKKKNSNGKIKLVEADLGTKSGVEKFINAVPTCDILVNNLGIYFPKAFEETTDEDWYKSWEINVMSGVRLSRHYLHEMFKKNWGRLIFISSESALQIPVEMIHYGVTKTAQIAIARGIAEMTVATSITSNSVLVGPTSSEGVKGFIQSMADEGHVTQAQAEENFFRDIRPTSLIKRFIKPAEVAGLVTYLCSEEAAAITGSALRIDGGVIKSII